MWSFCFGPLPQCNANLQHVLHARTCEVHYGRADDRNWSRTNCGSTPSWVSHDALGLLCQRGLPVARAFCWRPVGDSRASPRGPRDPNCCSDGFAPEPADGVSLSAVGNGIHLQPHVGFPKTKPTERGRFPGIAEVGLKPLDPTALSWSHPLLVVKGNRKEPASLSCAECECRVWPQDDPSRIRPGERKSIAVVDGVEVFVAVEDQGRI